MEVICARLGYIIHDRAHVAAVLGAEIVGDDLNLGYRVSAAEEYLRAAYGVVVVVLPIDLEVVRAPALAVRRNADAI